MTTIATLVLASNSFSAGFYAGVATGPEAASFNQTSWFRNTDSNVKDTTRKAGKGMFFSLLGGYGWNYQRYFLAGELNLNWSTLEYKSTNNEYIHKNFNWESIRIKQNWGVSLLPGYLFNAATLFFGRLGYTNANLKLSTSDTSLANVDRRINGFRYGLGIQEMLTKRLALRVEYSHINYQLVRFFVAGDNFTKTTKINPESGQVDFALIYNFA